MVGAWFFSVLTGETEEVGTMSHGHRYSKYYVYWRETRGHRVEQSNPPLHSYYCLVFFSILIFCTEFPYCLTELTCHKKKSSDIKCCPRVPNLVDKSCPPPQQNSDPLGAHS